MVLACVSHYSSVILSAEDEKVASSGHTGLTKIPTICSTGNNSTRSDYSTSHGQLDWKSVMLFWSRDLACFNSFHVVFQSKRSLRALDKSRDKRNVAKHWILGLVFELVRK